MTKPEAINLLDQVVQQYRGTRQEHILLQQAMEVVKKLVDPATPEEAQTQELTAETPQ